MPSSLVYDVGEFGALAEPESSQVSTGQGQALRDEEQCRRFLEAMIWPGGRICPGCGCRRSIALAGRELGRRARPGLYQCSDPACRLHFTVTTGTPLHGTKLALR